MSDAFNLSLCLWVSPKAKAFKKLLKREAAAVVVDHPALARAILAALPPTDAVSVRVADRGIDQAQLELRAGPQPDAPFPFADLVPALVSAPGEGGLAHADEALAALLPRREGPALPPTGILIHVGGPREAVLAWYARSLRALRVPGFAMLSRPGYEPSNRTTASKVMASGKLPEVLRAAIGSACGADYASAATLLPVDRVPLEGAPVAFAA